MVRVGARIRCAIVFYDNGVPELWLEIEPIESKDMPVIDAGTMESLSELS
jgi:hypothetical protein